MEFEHALRGPGFKPLEVPARVFKVYLGHLAVRRAHQQQRLDRRPGAAGGLCNHLHHAGILVEHSPFTISMGQPARADKAVTVCSKFCARAAV